MILKFQNHYKKLPVPLLYMQILNVLPNQFLLVNQILMILLFKITKNTNHQDFIFISKDLME